MDSKDIELARNIGLLLLARKQLLVTAESCTGGAIAALVTEVAGSSQWFDRGFVTYSNLSKQELLGIDANLINQVGAVSEEVVAAMTAGALKNSQAHWAIAVSGIAGPGGGTVSKPVGTVCLGWQQKGGVSDTQTYHFEGTRQEVRYQAMCFALQGLIVRLDN